MLSCRFCEHIFPVLPVISRSQLGLTSTRHVPELEVLEAMPVHLLAAIYASALPYASDDDYLSILNMYDKPPLDKIWRIVYELLLEEIHQPRLSALQAALLYLHKSPNDDSRYVISDTPFVWSFTGSVVGLATSLGLHIECQMWGIPGWEKRIRRRLWWAVYAEDKWRSLMMGRPPYIHRGEWDVSELQDMDFLFTPTQGASMFLSKPDIPFRDFVSLTILAESVQNVF